MLNADGAVYARFKAQIRVDARTGCWRWTGYVGKSGYAYFSDGEKNVGVHVYSFIVHKGPVPTGRDVGHRCQHRDCSRPSHLIARTRRQTLLRGDTIPARKAAQTKCEHGHALTSENVYRAKNGTRQCRKCRAQANREWAAKNRERRREIDRQSYHRRKAA